MNIPREKIAMLAKDYTEKKEEYPCYVEPKYDGVRVLAKVSQEEHTVEFFFRSGKEVHTLDHLIEPLLELDLGVTSDGVVVVIHNSCLEPDITRDCQGSWLTDTGPAVNSLTFKELKRFDVGRMNPHLSYSRRFPDNIAEDGVRIPALYEVFEFVKRLGIREVQFNIEIKLNPEQPHLAPTPREFVKAVVKVVKKHNMSERVTIQSFNWEPLQVVQEIAPQIPTSYLTVEQTWLDNIQTGKPGSSPWMAGFNMDNHGGNIVKTIKAAGGAVWASYFLEVNLEKVVMAHKLGLLVKVWTVNNRDDMQLLIDIGVDGIITDYPNILREVLSSRGIMTPAPILINT